MCYVVLYVMQGDSLDEILVKIEILIKDREARHGLVG